ncbi:MAG: aldo/keto reductase [Hydrogeniiclostridium mannosilyticum]
MFPFYLWNGNSADDSGENADDILDAALESGITTFDTACLYGAAERVLGDWIERRGVRSRVNVLTKGCYQNEERARVSPADIRSDLEESLEQLKLKSVDIYLLHRDDPSVPVETLVDCLNELKRAGKFKLFGGSNWSVERLVAANRYAAENGLQPFSISSPSYSLAEMIRDPGAAACGCPALHGKRTAGGMRRISCRFLHIPV